MIKQVLLLLCLGAPLACASDYYVDCNYGSNGNPGTSPQQAWRTLLQVGISSFLPGDTINLRRDCIWNETLTPPSSGSSGSLIKIDSYGNGQPPHLTGYMPIPAVWWVQVGSTNVWSATLYSTASGLSNVVQCGIRGFYCLTQPPIQLQYVRFGTVWGMAQGSQTALSHDRDFWYDATNYVLYVYSATGNPALHYSTVAPIVLSGSSVLNLSGVSWLEIQHLRIDWFDGYGVQVQGASDHLWLANMAADSEVENGAIPLGFYVQPTGTPVDIHLYNTDANMNYDGYRFDNCTSGGCAFEIKNCRAYGNRAYGIVDNVQGAVSYDYCHLYANYLATALPVDTSGTPGPTAGLHNIPAETPPWVREWHRWPAYTTVSYDDPGLVQYSDTYINSLLPIMTAKAIPLSIAVVTGGSYSQSIIGEVQGWINTGWDVNTHSISHEYWEPPAASCGANGPFPVPCHAFENLQYTGTIASSATLNVTHPTPGHATLTVTTSPDDPAADINWDLTPAAPGQTSNGLDTLGGILSTMKHPNDEIEEKVPSMGENDSHLTSFLPLPLVRFIDRTLEAERKLMEAEFRRRDAALEAHAKMDDLRHEAGDGKIQKADHDLERRLEEMNNFRAQINQERVDYLRRDMYERENAALSDRVKSLEIVRGEQSGKAAAYASMVGFAVVLVQIALHFWK